MSVSPALVNRGAQRRQETVDQIVAAAWELAAGQGIAAFSLAQLAARVGMRAPSLYSYFASKNAIYDAMFADGNRELLARTRALPECDDTRERLIAMGTLMVDFAGANPARYSLLFSRPVPGWEPSPEAFAVAIEVYERGRSGLTAAGLAQQEHMDLWTALIGGLMAQQVANDPGGDRWKRLVEPVVDMYLLHVSTSINPVSEEGR